MSHASGHSLLVLSILLFFAPLAVQAQQPDAPPRSVGYSSPDDTRPIDAYRLPDWSFSRFLFNGGSVFQSMETSIGPSLAPGVGFQREASSREGDVRLNPSYRAFWESESRVASLSIRPDFGYGFRNTARETTSGTTNERERESRNLRYGLSVDSRLDSYFNESTFIRFDASGRYSWRRDRRDETDNAPVVSIVDDAPEASVVESQARLILRSGIGFGRVRDVTPVIRALRVNERLQEIGQPRLSDDATQEAARQFAREFGYSAIHDRPDKFFWNDFFERATLDGADLSAFETFYLADVLQEQVGRRLSGADFVIGPEFRAVSRDVNPDNAPFASPVDAGFTEAFLFARGRYYVNPSLEHQFGLEYGGDVRIFSGGDASFIGGQQSIRTEGSWLWSVADRYLIDTQVNLNLDRRTNESVDGASITQIYRLGTDVSYFVEDQVQVTAGASVLHVRENNSIGVQGGDDQEARIWDIGLNVSVRYILTRSFR